MNKKIKQTKNSKIILKKNKKKKNIKYKTIKNNIKNLVLI